MKNMKNQMMDLSYATLNFLANMFRFLPYVLVLLIYKQNNETKYLFLVVLVYVVKTASIFMTKHLKVTTSTYLLICLGIGLIGTLCFGLTSNIYILTFGALCIGYTSANLWPYFLTVKKHLAVNNGFKLKKIYWLIFLIFLILFGFDIALNHQYQITFNLLSLLLTIAFPAALQMYKNIQPLYQSTIQKSAYPIKTWKLITFIIIFINLALLTFLRKVEFNVFWPLLLIIIGLTIILLISAIHDDWNDNLIYRLKLINRGFIINLVLFIHGFFSYFILGKDGMLWIFPLYFFGLEGGRPIYQLLKKYTQKDKAPEVSLIIGELLITTMLPPLYIIGILLITLYIGYENPDINQNVYLNSEDNNELAYLYKYRFSTYGKLLCQLIFFVILTLVCWNFNLDILNFFNSANINNEISIYNWYLILPISIISIFVSILAILKVKRSSLMFWKK
ncbi:hypothetical protein GSH19_03605 [Lactobacillus sp. S2-2]|uniref:hypothetical protein n=1 Tax=Lactobacillus sp. S2-2 TaxID=2692917 RepID=UPI001F2529EC|nr:hypothetical protein [Lactobacillus sp. S2-2]MCF6515238.1 hypothetical protein [Lactobacillus sp. S2-2]